MDRFTVLAVALILGGCGPAARPHMHEETEGRGSIVRTGDGYYVTLPTTEQSSVHTMLAPVETAWSALIDTYGELGIPIRTIDTGRWTLGNQALEFQRRFKGERLAAFFDCGSDVLGVPIANSYRIRASLLTRLEPFDNRTLIETRIDAVGTSTDGASSAVTECNSTGELEDRIATMVMERVAGEN